MKVYVVMLWDESGYCYSPCGVYSSEELARARVAKESEWEPRPHIAVWLVDESWQEDIET